MSVRGNEDANDATRSRAEGNFSNCFFIQQCRKRAFGRIALWGVVILLFFVQTPILVYFTRTLQLQTKNNNYEVAPAITIRRTKCGEGILPELRDSSNVTENLVDMISNDRAYTPKHNLNYNKMNHMSSRDLNSLFRKQTCLYDALTRWNQLAADLGISRWSVHGGSAIGTKCFGGMNPWDDDIDLTVLDCRALDEVWENGESNITSRYPTLDEKSHSMNNSAAIWDSRLIVNDELILTKGSRCCNWYKFMTVEEAFMWKQGDQIGGIDIECMSRGSSSRERGVMRQSKFAAFLRSRELNIVPFGPTTIQSVDPGILNHYIRLRYGKESPCQFPFTNGVNIETFQPEYSFSNGTKTTGCSGRIFQPTLLAPKGNTTTRGSCSPIFRLDQEQARTDFALNNWYIPKAQRTKWWRQRGDKKQMEYTKQIPNLDKIEIDNTISPGCQWGTNATLKVIGWNAERGTHWDRFHKMIQENDALSAPLVILMNEMDVGMARSGNLHTARRLALRLGMNYAYGVEFLELTRGTQKEQAATEGRRDAMSLHGNAILSKCVLGDGLILRDPLPHTYFSKVPHKGINADGYEVRLGGRMGLFARIFEGPDPAIPGTHNLTMGSFSVPETLPPHFVVGNVHKLEENSRNRAVLWSFYGFGAPPTNSTSIYDGKGTDLAASQKGVIVQGDFGPQFCSLGGLGKMNNYRIHKTFPSVCLPDGKSKLGPIAGDFFCSNMRAAREVEVTPPCDWSDRTNPLTLADHAIVSIEVESNKH